MGISELVIFISLMCNLDSPKLPFSYKQACIDSYNNCLVGPGGEILNRKISACIEKAKTEQKYWR